jgi:hypothetical protein
MDVKTQILNFLIMQSEPVKPLTIAKHIYGSKATARLVNPDLYSLLKEGLVIKTVAAENGKDPRWAVVRKLPTEEVLEDGFPVLVRGFPATTTIWMFPREPCATLIARFCGWHSLPHNAVWLTDANNKPLRPDVAWDAYSPPFTSMGVLFGGMEGPMPKGKEKGDGPEDGSNLPPRKVWVKKGKESSKGKSPVSRKEQERQWKHKAGGKGGVRGGYSALGAEVRRLDDLIAGAADARREIARDRPPPPPPAPREKPKKNLVHDVNWVGREFHCGKVEVPTPPLVFVGSFVTLAAGLTVPLTFLQNVGLLGLSVFFTSRAIQTLDVDVHGIVGVERETPPLEIVVRDGFLPAPAMRLVRWIEETPNVFNRMSNMSLVGAGLVALTRTLGRVPSIVSTFVDTNLVRMFNSAVRTIGSDFFSSRIISKVTHAKVFGSSLAEIFVDGVRWNFWFESKFATLCWQILNSQTVRLTFNAFMVLFVVNLLFAINGRPVLYKRNARVLGPADPTPRADERPDESSQQDIVHESSADYNVDFENVHVGPLGNVSRKVERDVVSFEVVTQLATPRVLNPTTTDEQQMLMLTRTAANLQTVNNRRANILDTSSPTYKAVKLAAIISTSIREKDSSFFSSFRGLSQLGTQTTLNVSTLVLIACTFVAIVAARL